MLREELAAADVQAVLALTAEQQVRFEEWSAGQLAALAREYDVDVSASQKTVSWGMRIVSTLGAAAICAALVLFFSRYWGYLSTSAQVGLVFALPLAALGATEWMAARETGRYFTGLLAWVAMASFVLDLSVIGAVFNIASTERALLVWGAFAVTIAYRYGLRLMLAGGLGTLMSYAAAAYTARLGYRWLDFYERPEQFILIGAIVFAVPFVVRHARNEDFPPVYRLAGALSVFVSMLSLADWGSASYLPWSTKAIERAYELAGLGLAAGAIWLGIRRSWREVVNTGAVFFALFLFARLYHWLWDWMPKYLFFAIIGAIGIGLVLVFKRLRAAEVSQ
jgi:uncharacterized membrane protein